MQVETKLFKMSQFLTDLTSPALTPYYSIEQTGNMLYESLVTKRKALESPRRDNTCASMGKFEKIGPKSRSERCFLMIFSDFFRKPQGPSQGKIWRFLKVFWCPGPWGMLPEWFWIDSGNFIFSWKFSKKWARIFDLCPSLSACSFHRFEVWDLESASQ